MELSIASLATYRPCWTDGSDERVVGPDEDQVTMAVAAGRAALDGGNAGRVVVVGREVGSIAAGGRAVIAMGLNLADDAVVETLAGGAASTVDALFGSPAGTLVIALANGSKPSAAALLTRAGAGLVAAGRAEHGMPITVSEGRHEDPRFLRERAWRPLLEELDRERDGRLALAGIPVRAARELGEGRQPVDLADSEGAPSPLFAAAAMADADLTGRVVAFDGGSGAAFDIRELGWPVARVERTGTVPLPSPPAVPAEIAISLSAYERAFEAKVGLKASECQCGELSLPPRSHCLNCGRQNATRLVVLPHEGEVYTTVTVHVPLPGMSVPYSLAIVSIRNTKLRLLAPVTDARAGSVLIGDSGELVLRRLAQREGIPDYGYAFQPVEVDAS